MDIKRKKELLTDYKNQRPKMGVLAFQCNLTGEIFLDVAADIAAKFNRICFQLSLGKCPNQRLQQLWTQYGRNAFELSVVQNLEYEEEDMEKDYTEELQALYEICLLENPAAQRIWK